MTVDHILVLGILIISIILFISEKLRADVVALLVLLAVVVSGLLTVEEAFLGFASPAVVTVWAVFIISGGLQRSGVADLIARFLLRWSGQSELGLLLMLMIGAGVMSAFMNNIGAVAILMPAVISIGRERSISPSKLLMPLAFAALLGGNLTLIGTPPNILATSLMADKGIEPFAFFDFLPTGLLVLLIGIAYMALVGRHLIPERVPAVSLSQKYHVREYLTEVAIQVDSTLLGRRIHETDLQARFDLNVVYVRSGADRSPALRPLPDHKLAVGDVLLLEGTAENIVRAEEVYRLRTVDEFSREGWEERVEGEEWRLGEIIFTPGSALTGRTLKEIDLRQRYGLSVMAVRHHGVEQVSRLGEVPIAAGDSLLVQGSPLKFSQLTHDPDFILLDRPQLERRRRDKIPVASAILLLVLVGAAFGVLHVAALMLMGALLMVLSGTIKMDEAYQSIDWRAIFLIAGMLPLGMAMEQTGTAQMLAHRLLGITGDWGPVVVLCTLFLLTALLTEVISNAAAAVLLVPIAIDVGLGLGLDPRPFVMGTVIAASTSFLLPIGHQVNILIFGVGGYRFFDYTRVGIWLNILLLLVVAIFVPLIWPFY